MATIKDVAAEAGVSVGTVSKVLRQVNVKEKNYKKVMDAIEKLDYRMNAYAQVLRTSRTFTIAIIVPDLTNPFFCALVCYVEQILGAIGYRLLLCNSQYNEGREKHYIEMVRQNMVDGLIALSYANLEEYEKIDFPFVSIDRNFGNHVTCVSCDNEAGGRLAAKVLLEKGCRKPVYLHNGVRSGDIRKRWTGFKSVFDEAGINVKRINFGNETTLTNIRIHLIGEELERLVSSDAFDFDGIFTSSDVVALVVKKKLEQLGFAIPEEVQLIGYDGLREMNIGDYYVSTIVQPVKNIAMACVENLLNQIDKKPYQKRIRLSVSFGDGGTTK